MFKWLPDFIDDMLGVDSERHHSILLSIFFDIGSLAGTAGAAAMNWGLPSGLAGARKISKTLLLSAVVTTVVMLMIPLLSQGQVPCSRGDCCWCCRCR